MLLEKKKRTFANGCVYLLETEDGYPVEVSDTFLPYETKDCSKGNNLPTGTSYGDRAERWMIGVSTMSGCPVGCKFCATGLLKRWRNLTSLEIAEQIAFVENKNPKEDANYSKEFKINYTRMGEPFLNLENVKSVIRGVSNRYPHSHHYVSTIGLKGSDFSWVQDNITLQISLHSLNEERRRSLIPIKNLMSIEELGQIRTNSNLKTTINLTLIGREDFDLELIKRYFDPEYFFIKLSPINENIISNKNGLGKGIVETLTA